MKSNAAEYFRSMSPVKAESRVSAADKYDRSGSGRSGRCHCCPYGYHIDLDFVRYCQALNQGAKNANPTLIQLKKLKKQRRRQTKSMEHMLGIHDSDEEKISSKTNNSYTQDAFNKKTEEKMKKSSPPSPPPRKQSLTHPALRSPPPPDLINSSRFYSSIRNEQASEALQEAVLDFEEALENSREYLKQKGKIDQRPFYQTFDLLHHTPSYGQPYSFHPTSKSFVTRSNSLPRQFAYDSQYYGQRQIKDWKEISSYNATTSINGYGNTYQSPLIADALSALNAAQGVPNSTQMQDLDTMSVTSAMSGVSTTTLQSIRDQMATGLSRLKELEDEVKSIPSLQVKMDILKEEKRILLEQVRCLKRGEEPPIIPPSIEKDFDAMSEEDLDGKLHSLKKFNEKNRRKTHRNRSVSPMRVNLEDFHSYRRARRGSLSEGSDSESVHSYRGDSSREREDSSRERDENRLFISESSDHSYKQNYGRKLGITQKPRCRDVAVSCKVVTRDVGVSYIAPRSRSVGTITDRIDEFSKKEIRTKPCMTCFRRSQKGADLENGFFRRDSGRLSTNSLSSDSLGADEDEINSKSSLLQKLGKKSPIISRLSSPQLFPPPLTFDNSTNTERIFLRDQRLNTVMSMGDLFTREDLDESIREAKKQWEATHKSRSSSPLKEIKKLTVDRSIQTYLEASKTRSKPMAHSVGVMVKQTMRDVGVGYSSIHEQLDKKVAVKTRSIGVGESLSFSKYAESTNTTKSRSIAVGDGKLDDILCVDCIRRKSKHIRSIGCGIDRITDNFCEKCKKVQCRNIGIGDGRITDEICKKCKLKRTVNTSCQVIIPTRSVGVEVNLPYGKGSKESAPLITTPESERRSFGSSGVRICDKCHEAITSVAKDIVNTSGSPSSSSAIPQNLSKIPRLMDYQSAEVKPDKTTYTDIPPPPKGDLSTSSSFPLKPERPLQKVEGTQSYTKVSSKEVTTSIPSLEISSQPKRIPYERQDTFTKMVGGTAGGFVNPAFEELEPKRKHSDPDRSKSLAAKTKEKDRSLEKNKSLIKENPKQEDAVIKGSEEVKSLSSSFDDEEDEAASVVASSIITTETQTTDQASSDRKRKKSIPTRELKAALKVLNDSIGKPFRSSQQLTNAINIIQRDWFKISSQKEVDPKVVEEYLDIFEDYSKGLLHRVVNLSDINGNTAMHYAVSHGNFDVVSLLLNSKVCNINQQNKAGYTAIMLVALAQIKNDTHKSVVNKLFETGDVNIKASQHGQTALMLAVSHGRQDMVRMLIGAGADPNIQDEDGSSALMCAAEHGHLVIVRYLIAQPDTDLYLMDNDESTALTIAVEAGHKDVGVLLYKQMNLSRGSSPYGSLRGAKRSRTPNMMRVSQTPPPRSSAPSSPGYSRKSSGRASPAPAKRSSASLSNLNF